MAILERHVQFKIKNEQTYREWEKSWEDLEARIGGFPAKRHYWLLSGGELQGTMVWEREWESLAVMEAAYTKTMGNEEAERLSSSYSDLYEGERVEVYFVWS
jgi:hypothetical protein